jgi:AcrR family transcriptional regulator
MALDRVLPVFWRDGFEGASVQELAAAVGVSKPSLYAAYGNKEALFLAALERYLSAFAAGLVEQLESEPDGRAAMRQYLRDTVALYTDRSHPFGCLIVTAATTSDSAAVPEAVRSALCASMRKAATVIEERLRRAQRDGHLRESADVSAMAHYFHTVTSGLSVQAKAGTSRETMLLVVDEAMKSWTA